MVKFFRKIRQNLLVENHFGKYLIYALGEIVLVVLGILIAFQLNDWNDYRKQIKLEGDYYCLLLDDVNLDEKQINNLIHLTEKRLKASNQSVRLLLNDQSEKIDIATQFSLSTKAIYADFTPNNSAYADLKNGAKLKIIRDKSIVKDLNEYFNRVEELKSIILINGKNAVDILYKHDDYFKNGAAQASIQSGRFKYGLDDDLKEKILALDNDSLSPKMRNRLLKEALIFVSVNTRQNDLYLELLDEITILKKHLESKCK